MPHTLLAKVFCPDRTGLVAGLAAALFDLGANLGDTRFAVLGQGAEFSAVLTVDDDVTPEQVDAALRGLPDTEGAEITVRRYEAWALGGDTAAITHLVYVSGGNRPGLVARLAEAFGDFDANIVTMNAQPLPEDPALPGGGRYVVRFAVAIPAGRVETCLATVSNTAQALGLNYRVESP